MQLLIFLPFALLLDHPGLTSGGALSPVQEAMDVKATTLVLDVLPEQKTLAGFAELTVALKPGLTTLELELVASLEVSEVWVNGRPRPFRREGFKLFIESGRTATPAKVRIAYHGAPLEAKNPPWSGGFNWSKTDSGMPWIGVSCQGEGGKVWFPCKTHPSDKIEKLTLRITVPKPLYCAANGLLREIIEQPGGKRTFHWETRYPISTYNVSINIAVYEVHERVYRGEKEMPVHFYVLKEYQRRDQVTGDTRSYDEKKEKLLDLVMEYLAFHAQYYGEYPFIEEKFAIAHTHYLGMEHQTINSYGNHFRIQDGYDWLLLHEMSHEWWGNKVSVDDWADIWIHEGIGSYATGVYLEQAFGLESALRFFQGLRRTVTNANPLVPAPNATSEEAYLPDVYTKGALVLHSLRFLLGKDPLNRILKDFANTPRFNYQHTVTTDDFVKFVEKASGRSLAWFFDAYLHRKALPVLTAKHDDQKVLLAWEPASFQMPVELEIKGERETRRVKVGFSGGKGMHPLRAGETYEVDPRGWVLKEFDKGASHDHSGR